MRNLKVKDSIFDFFHDESLQSPIPMVNHNAPAILYVVTMTTHFVTMKWFVLTTPNSFISDVELLELAREEFHRRLKAYQAWKQKNLQRKKKEAAKPDLPLSSVPEAPVQSFRSNVLSRNELSREVERWVWEKLKYG